MSVDREWIVGSAANCDLVVQAATVSSRHCRLKHRDGSFTIEDLGSTNGTFVNYRRIAGVTPVSRFDRITLGQNTAMPWPDPSATVPIDYISSSLDPGKSASAGNSSSSLDVSPAPGTPAPLRTSAVLRSTSFDAPPLVQPRGRRAMSLVVGLLGVVAFIAVCTLLSMRFSERQESAPIDTNELSRFTKHQDAVRCVAISPDGRWAVSGSDEKLARVWDVQTLAERGQLSGHAGAVTAVAISPDGKKIATGGVDGTVRLWDAETRKALVVSKEHTTEVTSLAFYPTGLYLLSASKAGRLILWNTSNEKVERRFNTNGADVLSIAVSPDSRRFVTAESTGKVQLWSMIEEKSLAEFTGHDGPARAVAYSPLDQRVLSCGDDGTVRLWDVDTNRPLHIWTPGAGSAKWRSVDFSPGATRAVAANDAGDVVLFSAADGERLDTFEGHLKGATCCKFSPTGAVIASGSHDRTLRLWRLRAPSIEEEKRMRESLEIARRRHEKFKEFAIHMERGQTALDDKRTKDAISEFQAAELETNQGTIEYQVAHDSSVALSGEYEKGQRYLALCKAGKFAAEKKDFDGAMQQFTEAEKLFPERDEAKDGYKEAKKAKQLKLALSDINPTQTFNFAELAPKSGLLRNGKNFAYLLVRSPPPMAYATTALQWTIEIDTPVDFPEVDVRLRVEIVYETSGEKIVSKEHPFVAGVRHQSFRGLGAPGDNGWQQGNYALSTFLVTPDGVTPQGRPAKFQMGVLRWIEKQVVVTPESVQTGNYRIDPEMQISAGDGLIIRALGTVTPAPTNVYQTLMGNTTIKDPIPASPEGLTWDFLHPPAHNYRLVEPTAKFAALLLRLDGKQWLAYRNTSEPDLMLAAGRVELSLNSIVQYRASPSQAYRGVTQTDHKFWKRDSGQFDVTILHGKFDFPDLLSNTARSVLLKRFEDG